MASATARVPKPGNEKGRPGTGRPFDLINYGTGDNNIWATDLQYLAGPIIREHWLRVEEAANG